MLSKVFRVDWYHLYRLGVWPVVFNERRLKCLTVINKLPILVYGKQDLLTWCNLGGLILVRLMMVSDVDVGNLKLNYKLLEESIHEGKVSRELNSVLNLIENIIGESKPVVSTRDAGDMFNLE